MKSAAVCMLAAALAGCATTRDVAISGSIADAATTIAATSAGYSELNPLGVVGTIAIKPAAIAWIDSQPQYEQRQWWDALGAVSWGAAANNLCLLSGGAACLPVGIAAGVFTYWINK